MRLLKYLIFFGFGVIIGYLIQGYPTVENIKSSILTGISIGVSLGVVGVIVEKILGEFLNKRDKQREELNKRLQNHSGDLVEEVLKKWFIPKLSVRLRGQDSDIIAQTSLDMALYESHSKSRIEEYIELHNLKYVDQAIEHIKRYDIWNKWLECEKLSNIYLEKNIKLCEDIEKKVAAKIPKEFIECDIKISPPTCYIPDETVVAIYQEANHFMKRNIVYGYFKKIPEQEYFKVGEAKLYARSPNEDLADEFIKIVYEIIMNKNLIEELKSLNEEKKIIDEQIEIFKRGLEKIIDDFEKGYINLKGSCSRCKAWR